MKRVCLIPAVLVLAFSLAAASSIGQHIGFKNPGWRSANKAGRKAVAPSAVSIPKVMSVWFTSNGVASQSSPQGEIITWATACQTEDTLEWFIYIETGDNGQLDTIGLGQDKLLFDYITYNGDPGGNGPGDTSGTGDNLYVARMNNGFGTALYWFKVTSLVDGTTAWDSVRVTAMPSPWATISGHVHVPGDSSLQANIWVEADPDFDDDMIFWGAVTDSFGDYTINLDGSYPDSAWNIGNLTDIAEGGSFYVAPVNLTDVIGAGAHAGYDFAYLPATDSVTGEVRDELSASLPMVHYVYAQQSQRQKTYQVSGGHYQLFFAASDTGTWEVGCWWEEGSPYMYPQHVEIQPAGAGHLVRDFKAYRATDSIMGTVTEQGGVPSRTYSIYAWSDSLQISSSALTDPSTGAYKLMVSDSADYNVGIDVWSDDYPIPDGWTVNPGGYSNVNPPATGNNFDLSPATEFIEGQITQDPGDIQAIDFSQTWVQASPVSGGSGFQSQPDMMGQYSIPVKPDSLNISAGSQGFLFKPAQYQNVAVLPNDTIRDKDFTANYGHCRVEVTLVGYPADSIDWMGAVDETSWPDGYVAMTQTDGPGTYSLYICNSNGWGMWAPNIDGYNVSPGSHSIGDITHGDTVRTGYIFTYTPSGVSGKPNDALPSRFLLSQNSPNPVRGMTNISYQLPKPAKVSLVIYNILGQTVRNINEGGKAAGYYNIRWDGRDNRNNLLGNGIYFYRLQAGEFTATKKMVLMR